MILLFIALALFVLRAINRAQTPPAPERSAHLAVTRGRDRAASLR